MKSVSIALAAAAAAFSMSAQADDFSAWEVRVGAVRVKTQESSSAIPGLLPAGVIEVQSKPIPEVDISYFFTKNISAELVLTYPQKMDVAINAGGIGHLGTVDVLPPDLMGQYHFMPDNPLDPYVGAGINVTWLTSTDLNSPVAKALNLSVSKTSVEPAFQFGMDYKFYKNWVANLDAKYELMKFDVRSNGATVSRLDVNPWLLRFALGY